MFDSGPAGVGSTEPGLETHSDYCYPERVPMGETRLFIEVGGRVGAGVIIDAGIRIPRGTGGRTDRAARLLCDCGNEYVLALYRIIGQRIPRLSCGCLTKKLQSAGAIKARAAVRDQHGPGFIDRTGQRYGKLVVIELAPPAPGSKICWLCRCDCGNKKAVRAECLSQGVSRSCGCVGRGPKLPPGIAARNQVLKSYRGAARARGYSWELSGEDFDRLTAQDCFYCGTPPSTTYAVRHSKFVYNGIDRVDNLLGYTPVNAVTCCQICNRAKGTLPYSDFVAWLGRVTAYQSTDPVVRSAP